MRLGDGRDSSRICAWEDELEATGVRGDGSKAGADEVEAIGVREDGSQAGVDEVVPLGVRDNGSQAGVDEVVSGKGVAPSAFETCSIDWALLCLFGKKSWLVGLLNSTSLSRVLELVLEKYHLNYNVYSPSFDNIVVIKQLSGKRPRTVNMRELNLYSLPTNCRLTKKDILDGATVPLQRTTNDSNSEIEPWRFICLERPVFQAGGVPCMSDWFSNSFQQINMKF